MVNLSKWQECISDSTMRSFFNLTQSLNFTRSTKVPGGFSIVNHTIWGQTLILDWGTRLRAVVEPLDLCKAVNMGLTVPGLSTQSPLPTPSVIVKGSSVPWVQVAGNRHLNIWSHGLHSIHKPPSQAPHGHDLDMLCVWQQFALRSVFFPLAVRENFVIVDSLWLCAFSATTKLCAHSLCWRSNFSSGGISLRNFTVKRSSHCRAMSHLHGLNCQSDWPLNLFWGPRVRNKVKVANEGGKVLGGWKQVPGFDCGGGAPPISCLWGPSHPLTSLPPANDCVEIFLPHRSRVPVSLHTVSSAPGF